MRTLISKTPMLSRNSSKLVTPVYVGNSTCAEPNSSPESVRVSAAETRNTFLRPHFDSERSDAAPRIGPRKNVTSGGTKRGIVSEMPMEVMYEVRTSWKMVSSSSHDEHICAISLRAWE